MRKDRKFGYTSFSIAKETHIVNRLSDKNVPTPKTIKICDQIPVSDGFPAFFNPKDVRYATISLRDAGEEDVTEDADKRPSKNSY